MYADDTILAERWPQGEHPYDHHDPDSWRGWSLFTGRWLLSRGPLSVDLWGVWDVAPLSVVLRRVEAIRPALDDCAALGLKHALDDIYRPTLDS